MEEKLHNWELFVHGEAIHPFDDGNGRTGRILNILLYLSRYIIETKSEYYRLLLEVTRSQQWEEWILYMLEGARQTSISTVWKIQAIRELQDNIARQARATSKGGANAEFLSVLFEQPYCRIAIVMDRCGVSRPTATSWLTAMAEAGLLEDRRSGRDRLFLNRRFLNILLANEEPTPTLGA